MGQALVTGHHERERQEQGRPVGNIEKVAAQAAPPPAPPLSAGELAAFEDLYRKNYRLLVKIAMYMGAGKADAEDAADEAMTEVFTRWRQITSPVAYARRAVVSHFLKNKERGPDRVRARLRERGEGRHEGREDTGLTIWEDTQWVTQLLRSLPPAQREVMALVVDEFPPGEIATLLGRNPPAIRQNLAAARRRLAQALEQDNAATRHISTAATVLREAP
jgi:RNA polymerase sigma factor (sigma-70 family)